MRCDAMRCDAMWHGCDCKGQERWGLLDTWPLLVSLNLPPPPLPFLTIQAVVYAVEAAIILLIVLVAVMLGDPPPPPDPP